MNVIQREPVALTGALTVFVNSLIALAIGFEWVHWDSAQIALVTGVWNALIAVVLTFVVRPRVTPEIKLAVVDGVAAHDAPPPPIGNEANQGNGL